MEKNLMERLLNDFNGVLEEFNQLVANNDIDGVRKVLNEVNRLVQERSGIVLDDRESQYDHVLHEILDKMEGIVEREVTVQGIDGVPGSRYYTNDQIEEMIAEAEAEQRRLAKVMKDSKDVNNEAYASARSQRSEIIKRIANLRAVIVPNQEFSTMTFVDENLRELQERRARLVQEKNDNLAEIERLKAEETPGVVATEIDQARIDEINSRMAEIENLIPDLESQINDIRGTNLSQIIESLRAQTGDRTDLESRLATLQEQLRAAGDRIRATRGFDEQNAQAIADQFAITQEISEVQAQLDSITPNESNIEFLESLIPESQSVTEPVLDPMDYTYMGRLTDEQIIRRLLSEQLNLSEEEINETIGEYSLVQVDDGAHDEYGEDEPISMRQLVRTRVTRGDITVGEAITNLEAELYDGAVTPTDHTQEITEIDNRIAELDNVISEAESRISEIENLQISDLIAQRQENARIRVELESRLETLQEQLRVAGDRIRETRGFDEQNAQAHSDFSALTVQINDVKTQINALEPDNGSVEFLETLLSSRDEASEREAYESQMSEMQSRLATLQEQLRTAGDRIRETRGFDEQNAQAHSDYNAIVEQISALENQIRETEANQNKPFTVKDAYDNKIAEMQSRLETLQEQLRVAGDRIRETRGFDEQNAQAHSDYNALVNQISNLEAQIKDFESQYKEATGIKKEEDKIAEARKEQEELRARKTELENDSAVKENPEIREKLNRLKEITGIAALEKQIERLRAEADKLKEERDSFNVTPGKTGVDNSDKIAALETRNKEIDEEIRKIDDQIKEISGAVPIQTKTTKERLDVKEEANKIGDHIFKTAQIRRELAKREVSRDEFLVFYQAGKTQVESQMQQLNNDFEKMREEIRIVTVDSESDISLNKQIKAAEESGDTELTRALYEKLRKNFITAGREEQLKSLGIDHEITSLEDVIAMKKYFEKYKQSVEKGSKDIRESLKELKEDREIFDKEIERIKAEKATLELAGETPEELVEKSNARKDLRRALLEASITPENELIDEQIALLDKWQNASERFLSKQAVKKFTYTDKEGNVQSIEVDTIDDSYKEYNQDIEFLGVPAYKENLEQLSAYEQTDDPYVFGEEVGLAFDEAEAQRPGSGREVIDRIMADKQKYVETFNGIPNPHKVKYENWKTAGSTLKGMKPVSRDLPMATRAKNAGENALRFLGIRIPKFTRLDEHGNKVNDIKGGIATTALDALVVGGVAVTAATLGPIIPVVGYAAKGIVTAGNKIAARIEYSRHKDEIDGNKPVINQADRNAREVARKEYYREQGDNRFVSWVKAKADKYITRGRERETEKAIVDKLVSQFEEIEDKRTEALKENVEIARANQEARMNRQEQIAMGANTYNDIVRDPDSVDMDRATAAIARNAALQANKQGVLVEDVNPDSKVKLREQYVKEEKPVAKTSDLNIEAIDTSAVSGPVSAITEEQIYTGRKQHVDRMNKVLTAVTAAGLKFAYSSWKDGLTDTEVIHHEAVTEEQTIHHDAEYGEVQVNDYETQYDTSKTLEELRQNYAGKTTNEYYSVSGGLKGQRTEELVDKGITAGWFDDSSKWGTGIADSKGLSAPVLTDRLAETGLIDANGMLRQDITVQQMLDVMGCTNPDLSTLDGIYMSVGDQYWVKLSDLMQGMTKEVVIGSHPETQLIKEAWDEVVVNTIKEGWDEEVTKFAGDKVFDAIKDGAIIGAGIGAVDALHEAAQNTYINDATPGRPEETTPEATDTFDKMTEKLQERANMERQARETENEEPEHDEDNER